MKEQFSAHGILPSILVQSGRFYPFHSLWVLFDLDNQDRESKPNVWYGAGPIDGRYLYLFDRSGNGIIQWDTEKDKGKIVPWPYKVPFPASGGYIPEDKALWCRVWDFSRGQYVPVGIARLDLTKETFTGFYPFPDDASRLEPFTDAKTTLFFPNTLKGKIVPFDWKTKKWHRSITVPEYGKRFAFLGGPIHHKGQFYFSLSTYNGTDLGCDGQPYHFLNEILQFNPSTNKFQYLTLESKDRYYQIAYMLSSGGEFFATGVNIREPDGKLNRDRSGEVLFWQTVRPQPSK